MKTSIPSSKKSMMGAKMAIENADRHYQCALHLYKIEEYGVAQAHLILGIEEAIKSLYLYFKGLGIPIRQNILNDLLKRHRLRYTIGEGLYVMVGMAVMMASSLISDIKKVEGATKQERELARRESVRDIINDLRKSEETENANTKFNRIILPLIKWWKKIGRMRNAGFYVDFMNGIWCSPKAITKNQFNESKEIANNVILYIKQFYEFFELLSDKEKVEIATEMKSKYRDLIKKEKDE